MKIADAYILFQELVNRNATNNNTSVDESRFVLLFNWTQNKYVEWLLEKRNEDDARDISRLLVPNKKLSLIENKTQFSTFKLPKDYFNASNAFITAKKDNCIVSDFLLHEVKPENVHELLADSDNEPTFEYRETFYHYTKDAILIYKKEFDIEKAFLTYYRYPIQVDIAGYIKADDTQSTNIDPEFDDKSTQKILLAMAKEFAAINNDQTAYSLTVNRLFSEI